MASRLLALSLLLILISLLAPAAARASTAQLRRYPYLTDLVNQHALVNWATDTSVTAASVSWGKVGQEACTAHTATATSIRITVNGLVELQWKGALNGLTANSQYCYRVFANTGTIDLLGSDPSPVFWSQIPAGDTTPFSFAVFGDWGYVDSAGVNPYQAKLMNQIALSDARFALTTGDNGYTSGSQTNYGDLVQTGSGISAVFGPQFWPVVGTRVPLFPAMGNHGFSGGTAGTAKHTQLINWPQDQAVQSSNGRFLVDTYCCLNNSLSGNYPSVWYAFDAGVARFYVLTAAWSEANAGNDLYQTEYSYHWAPDAAEVTWLKNDLATHASKLKFAFFHYPIYADNLSEKADPYLQGAGNLESLLDSYGVNLVFNGHAHIYQRNTKAPAMNQLSTYVTGGGGAKLQSIGPCSTLDAYGRGWGPNKCGTGLMPTAISQVYHFLLVHVSGSQVTVSPTDSDGNVFDPLTYTYGTTSVGALAPTQPTNMAGTLDTSNKVSLTWGASTDAVGVVSYIIRRDTAIIATVNTTTLAYVDATTAESKHYKYTVEAVNAANKHSVVSNVVQVQTADITPPTQPTQLASTLVNGRVKLTWSAASDAVGVTSYVLSRDGIVIKTVDGRTLTYTDASVSDGKTYSYSVHALDAAGHSSIESTPVISTLPDITMPTSPAGLLATAASASQIDLAWQAATDNTGVAQYLIRRNGALLATIDGTVLHYSDTGLHDATGYDYTVEAVDLAQNHSAASNHATARTPDGTPPAAPTELHALVENGHMVELDWNAASDNVAVAAYTVARDGVVLATLSATTQTYTDQNAQDGTSAVYTVAAHDSAGNQSPQPAATTVLLPDVTPPTAPTELRAVIKDGHTIELTWNAASDNVAVVAYTVARDGVVLATLSGTTQAYTDQNVQDGTSAVYMVTARDGAGNQSPQTAAPAVVMSDVTAPSTPDGVSAVQQGQRQIAISWHAATDNIAVTRYIIMRNGVAIAAVPGDTWQYLDTSATFSSDPAYSVVAVDAAGNQSVPSQPTRASISYRVNIPLVQGAP